MKDKHLAARIAQCHAISSCSGCVRSNRKFGAIILDPERNVILADGYNGAPRGAGDLCGDWFCERQGVKGTDFEIESKSELRNFIKYQGRLIHEKHIFLKFDTRKEAYEWISMIVAKYPGVPSGTHMEIGCHHAEQNAICNAAAGGVATRGAWMITTGEPCRMCAKLIHHAGITKIITLAESYSTRDGIDYLEKNGVGVEMYQAHDDMEQQGT